MAGDAAPTAFSKTDFMTSASTAPCWRRSASERSRSCSATNSRYSPSSLISLSRAFRRFFSFFLRRRCEPELDEELEELLDEDECRRRDARRLYALPRFAVAGRRRGSGARRSPRVLAEDGVASRPLFLGRLPAMARPQARTTFRKA